MGKSEVDFGLGMRMNPSMEILHIYVAPVHAFIGSPGEAVAGPLLDVPEVHCLAGRGLEGDRFLDHKEDYIGQVTFFEQEVYEDLCARLGVSDKAPGAFRRNVITRGADLNALIGQEFEVQGVRFFGTQECAPCKWMNEVFHPEAKAAMAGHGGLRAKILTDGWLRRTA